MPPSEGLRTVLVERQATGGQAGQEPRIENYLGFPDGVTGTQLTDRARRQAHKFGAEVLTTRDVVGLDVRVLADSPVRRRWRGRCPRCCSPPGSLPASSRCRVRSPHRPRRLLRVGDDRGARVVGDDVYIVGGANSRAKRRCSCLGTPQGHDPGGADSLENSMSYTSSADRGIRQHRRAGRHRGDRGPR